MKVKFTRNSETIIETDVTSINIDENGYVDFYTPDNYYFTTTQGRNPEDTETTLWLEKFEEDEGEEAMDMVGLPFSDISIYIMFTEDWIELPKRDIFEGR